MGGVLLDWNPRHLYRKLIPDPEEMERFLATVTTTQWHGLQDQGGNPAEATRRLTADHPSQEALIEAFYSRFDEMLDHPFPQMADLVERLHATGTPLYLLSNAPGFLDPWLRGPAHRRHPFLGHFRDYVVSGHVGCCKPDATIYDLVCRRLLQAWHEDHLWSVTTVVTAVLTISTFTLSAIFTIKLFSFTFVTIP